MFSRKKKIPSNRCHLSHYFIIIGRKIPLSPFIQAYPFIRDLRVIVQTFKLRHVRPNFYWSFTACSFTLQRNDVNDLSIASTKTKYYIKLNTKTQNIFCRLNENLTTFLYTLTGATIKQKEKKSFLF